MAKQQFILIEEQTLRKMAGNSYQNIYVTMLLSYLCMRHNLDTFMTVAEACGVLGLSPRQVEEECKQCRLHFLSTGKSRLYSSYDLAMLAARLHGKHAMALIKEMPKYVCNPHTKPAEV